MKSLLKILLTLVGLAIVLVIAAAVTVANIDPNEHKDWIIAKVQEKTGRTLAIDGNVTFELYPWLGMEADGVTMGNAKGFGPEPFMKVGHAKARIKLLPLLRDQYEVDTVWLEGATINLARNKDGVTNWADLTSDEPSKGKPIPLTAIVLGGVDIRTAQINWSDEATGIRYEVKDLTANTGPLTYGAPIKLAVSLKGLANQPALDADLKLEGVVTYDLDAETYSAKPLTLSGTLRGKNVPGGQTPVALSANVDVNLDDDTASVSDLKLDILQMAVTGRLDAAKLRAPQPSVKADLVVQGSDLAVLFKVAEVEPLATQLAQVADRKFDLKARVDADLEQGNVDVPEFKANLLGAKVQGELKATNVQTATPGIKGAIDASGPDLPNLLQVAGQVQGGAKSTLSRYGRQLANAPDQAFAIKTTFDADLKRGVVDVPIVSLKIAGATVNGRVKAENVQSDTPSYKGMLDAAGPDLPVLMLAAGAGEGNASPLLVYGRKLSTMQNKAFAIKADFDADLKKGNIDLPALSVQTLGVDVNGKLKATDMNSSGGSIFGQLAVKGEKLGELLRAVDQADLGEVLRSVNLDVGINGKRSDLNLKPLLLKAVVASPDIKDSPVTVSLDADTRVNLDSQSLQLDTFTLKGLGLNVQGNLKASNIETAPEFSGQVNVGEFNPRQLMLQLKQKPPITADKEVFRKVALNSGFSGTATSFSLSKLALKMDETNLTGDLDIKDYVKPTVRFGFDVDQIDADRYLPPPPPEDHPAPQGKKNVKLGGAASAAASLPVELLRSLDIDGKFTIGKLKISDIRSNDVKLALAGKNGILKLDPMSAKLYQGTHTGDVTLDATGNVPKLTINSKLNGVQVEPLLTDMQGESKLKGAVNFNAALVAVGKTPDQFKKTLNGQMAFALKDGAFKGYNLGKIMRQGNALKQNFSLNVSDKEETDLSDVTGNPVAQNGVIRMDDLAGKSPGLRLSGKGVLADLPRNVMDYKLTAYLVATSKGAGGDDLKEGKLEGVPLDCTMKGPLEAPKRECDASKLLAALGVKLLQGVLGTPSDLIPSVPGLSGAASGASGAAGAVGAAGAAALGGLLGSGGKKDSSDDSKSTTTTPKSSEAPVKSTATPPKSSEAPAKSTTTTPKSPTTTTKPAPVKPAATKPAATKPATTKPKLTPAQIKKRKQAKADKAAAAAAASAPAGEAVPAEDEEVPAEDAAEPAPDEVPAASPE